MSHQDDAARLIHQSIFDTFYPNGKEMADERTAIVLNFFREICGVDSSELVVYDSNGHVDPIRTTVQAAKREIWIALERILGITPLEMAQLIDNRNRFNEKVRNDRDINPYFQ